jgi:16S rRNA (guanine966-N2)-methyltransferase
VSRVIAGSVGGRSLVLPTGTGTRPTADRAREGLFSTLLSMRGSLDDTRFLDLFAGSGAVGIEAASRGASPVVLVERDAKALRAIHANVESLGLAAAVTVRAESVDRLLTGDSGEGYDVVFADPPYVEAIDPVLSALRNGGWLRPDGIVCVERATRDAAPTWPAGVEALRSRRYGEATLWYGRRS